MRLFSALGPGDIVSAHRAQMSGKVIVSETSIIFSGQLIEYCLARNIETLAISSNPRVDEVSDGIIHLENRPRRWRSAGGIRFHLSKISYAGYLAWRAWRFGADLALIDSGSAHYFALTIFKVFNVPVAINFHNTLWPNGFEPVKLVPRLLLFLDKWFFRLVAVGATGVSPECGKQVKQVAARPFAFFEYRAQFQLKGFEPTRMDNTRNPFRIMFVGRAERNKGVLDIAVMAERMRRSAISIVFEVCGDGEALSELRQVVNAKNLGDIVVIRGRLERPQLLQAYARAHAIIVPTRSDFCEGLPMVCAEAMLAGLPIITSRLSNAIPVLGPALIEADPENIESYVQAILQIAENRVLYEKISVACPDLAGQFLDRSQSFPAAIDRLISYVFPGSVQLKDYEPLFARIH